MVHSAAAKKQEAPLIEVIDERTQPASENKSGGMVTSVSYDENGTAEMQLNLANPQAQDLAQVQEGVPVQEGSKATFASMLSTEIRNNAGEFVKTGLITLRDNKSGTINLVLHPEELGNVKIKLELSDKLITGKIIVSSEEAYSAFKNNIESLRQAFLSSGFDSAGFELAWSGSGESEGRHGDAEQGKNPRGLDYADSMPLAAGAEDMADGYFGLTSVNMVV
jgi:flagellar hook-length control protein FliK